MKKSEPVRDFKFSDGRLIATVKEKTAFMKRDAATFANYGIATTAINDLQNEAENFSDFITDVEARSDQSGATALKDQKAEELRMSIRAVMVRAEAKYGANTAKYRKFGTEALSKQPDVELLLVAKRVVRVATQWFEDLATHGLTLAMIQEVHENLNSFDNLVVDFRLLVGDRDILQEDRVDAANALYKKLIGYTTIGMAMWETSDIAKYNDYVVYNTVSGNPEPETLAD